MTALALSLVLAAAADHPCLSDADRFCKGVEPGGGRIAACLNRHQAELSPACKEKRDSFRERAEQILASCQGDVEQFCAGVTEGRGNIARCLRKHAPELSPGCKKDLEQAQRRGQAARANYEKIQMACALDEQRFCSGVDVGGGAMMSCLKKHQQSLSIDCKQALAQPAPGAR